MTRTAPLTLAAFALLVTACGGQAPVELDVAPAGTVEEVAPEPLEEVAPAPVPDAEGDDDAVDDARDEGGDEAADPVAPSPSERGPAPTPAPSTGTSSQPAPPPADPELVIDEDGCVTDVATGLVVTCHDPAAGPDDES